MSIKDKNCANCIYMNKKGCCVEDKEQLLWYPVWTQGCSKHQLGTKEELEQKNFYYYPEVLTKNTN